MRFFFISLLLLSALQLSAQDTTFVKVYYGVNLDLRSKATAENQYNGVTIAGEIGNNGLVIQVDSLGELSWARTVESLNSTTQFTDIINCADSGYVVSGKLVSTNGQGVKIACIKFDKFGDTIWTRKFDVFSGTSENIGRCAVSELYDSTYVLSWSDQNANRTMIVRMDPSGAVLWDKVLTVNHLQLMEMTTPADSMIYIAGIDGTTGGVIVKVNPAGEVQWCKGYPQFDLIDLSYSGNDIYGLYANTSDQLGVMRLDTAGTISWMNTYSLNYVNGFQPPGVRSLTDSTLVVYKGQDGWDDKAIKIDTSGNVLQERAVYMELNAMSRHIKGGGFIVGNGPLYGLKTYWNSHIGLYKVDKDLFTESCSYVASDITTNTESCVPNTINFIETSGVQQENLNAQIIVADIHTDNNCVDIWGGVEELETIHVEVFPNVTSSSVKFLFEDEATNSITIHSLGGEEIFCNTFVGNCLEVDVRHLESGIYFYTCSNGSGTMSGKFVKM